MFIKPFNSTLHSKYDEPTKYFVKKYYHEQDIQAVDNPDIFGVDLILYKDGIKIGYAEVECCVGWNENNYPFNTYHIPLRKTRFFNLELPTEFWAVSNTFRQAFHINGDDIIYNTQIKIVQNKYNNKNEEFYDIDLRKLKHYKLVTMI
jgi:hypothetical protein